MSGKEWIAGRPLTRNGKLNRVGGMLVLADDTVTFRPILRLGRTRRYRVADIVGIESVQGVPPKLHIELRDGSSVTFMVVTKKSSAVWTTDSSARDDAVASISALLHRS